MNSNAIQLSLDLNDGFFDSGKILRKGKGKYNEKDNLNGKSGPVEFKRVAPKEKLEGENGKFTNKGQGSIPQ